jgi:hypothetical protein
MDADRFDAFARSVTAALSTRRTVLIGAASVGLAAAPASGSAKRRKRRVKRNAFGCVNVGGVCKHGGHCCSGLCEGTKRRRTCRAHDTGGCRAGNQPQGCNGTDIVCTTSTGNPKGVCATTTGNGGYCVYSGGCYPCQTDADCQELCGPRGACFLCDDCPDTGGTSCGSPDHNGCDFP